MAQEYKDRPVETTYQNSNLCMCVRVPAIRWYHTWRRQNFSHTCIWFSCFMSVVFMIRLSIGIYPVSTFTSLLSTGELSLDCRRCLEQNSSIKMENLPVYVCACLTTKIQDCSPNISVFSRSTYINQLAYPLTVHCFEQENRPAGISCPTRSSRSLCPSSLTPSPGKIGGNIPGEMQLTLTRRGKNVWAHSLVKCIKAALVDENANCPWLCVLVRPAADAILMIALEWPGVCCLPLSSNGSRAAVRKWWEAILPE